MSLNHSQTLPTSREDLSSSSSSSSRAPEEDAGAGLKPCTPTRKPKLVSIPPPTPTPPQLPSCSMYPRTLQMITFISTFFHREPRGCLPATVQHGEPSRIESFVAAGWNRSPAAQVVVPAGSLANEKHRKDFCFRSAVRGPLYTTGQLAALFRATWHLFKK